MRRRLKCPRWLYRWIDREGYIPKWVRWLWPCSHWCDSMDGLLIIDNVMDCYCGNCEDEQREYRAKFFAAVKKQQDKFDRDNDFMLF